MDRHGWQRRAVALDAWPALLALVLCAPLLVRPGHPLARDLVFVPHQPWTDATVGLGDTAPRAVPLDALVSLLDDVVDGGVLARLLVPLVLATAGWGMHRLVRDLGTLGRFTAGGLAVWNPYVVERLALGQWALLAGYAALPWLLVAARRLREERHGLAPVVAWVGLASITPTGGLLASATALVVAGDRSRRTAWLAPACLVLQLPWLVPSFLGAGGGTSDPAGVDAFSAGREGPGGPLVALLGLGGIWDHNSVPVTRDALWAPVTAVVVVLAIAVAWRTLARTVDLPRLAWLAGGGLLLAAASTLPGGSEAVGWVVEHVPGAGLLRDSQKLLAPYVVLACAALGATAHVVVRALARHGVEVVFAVVLVAAPLPLLLLPDGAMTTWDTVDPVTYPAGFDRVADELEGEKGDLAVLPWRAYRGFSWGNGLASSDPALRWFDRTVLVSDDLQVGDTLVRGESVRGGALGEALASGSVADALVSSGVTWALVYRDDPGVADLDLTGLREVYADDDLALYRIDGVLLGPGVDQPPSSTAERVLVGVADGLALVLVLPALGWSVRRAARRGGDHTRTPSRW